MTHLIEAAELTKRFRTVTALDRLDLAVPAGEITAVLGPNGPARPP
jgi:ABC-2 type transport system ATP-binding protein